MTKQTEALKMAHKTFMQLNERHPRRDNGDGCFDKELKTINEALEQPANEPVMIGIDFAQNPWKERMIKFLKEKQICAFDNNKIIMQSWIDELENTHD